MLAGIGASAAVLMLVFQDTIIGLVAGVQLAAYDMIHKGDWVVMEKNNINGIVVDVNLNTVKVRNWDYSIVTVPPHALMTESFNNYRNMRHAKARRITIKLMLDSRTVVEAEEQLMKKLSEKGMLVDSKDLPGTVDDPILTNLHLFSMYVEQYMMNLPHVNVRGLLMVRIGAPTAQGLPVEAYCHINKVDWKPFEQAHARLVEHLLAVLPYFGLSVFQSPTDTSINKKI